MPSKPSFKTQGGDDGADHAPWIGLPRDKDMNVYSPRSGEGDRPRVSPKASPLSAGHSHQCRWQVDSRPNDPLTASGQLGNVRGMTDSVDDLPDDIERLKALVASARQERDAAIAERDQLSRQNDRLRHTLSQLRRNQFGRKSEKLDADQLNLGLEDIETAIAAGEASEEKTNATLAASRARERKVNRGRLPPHLPREEIVIEPPSNLCPCCGGALHRIGEDVSERLDKIPSKLKVIVTRRPKYACRTCEKTGADDTAGIIQAAAPAHLVEGGLPTEAFGWRQSALDDGRGHRALGFAPPNVKANRPFKTGRRSDEHEHHHVGARL